MVLGDGLVLGSLTVGGFYLVYRKLPPKVRAFMEKHALLTDAVALYGTYILMGGGVTALFAAAWAGILTSIMLYIAANPQEFRWLHDFLAFARDQACQFRDYLNKVGREYGESKARQGLVLAA